MLRGVSKIMRVEYFSKLSSSSYNQFKLRRIRNYHIHLHIFLALENKKALDSEKEEEKKTTRMKRTVSTSAQLRRVNMRNAEDLKHWNEVEKKDLKELENHQRKHFVAFDQATWDKRESRDNEYKNTLDEESNLLGIK